MISGDPGEVGTWTVVVLIGAATAGSPNKARATSDQLLQGRLLDLTKRAEASSVVRVGGRVSTWTWFRSALTALEAVKEVLGSADLALSASLVTGECSAGDIGSRAAQKAHSMARVAAEGQALVSLSTYEVVRDVAPASLGFKDLGTVKVDGEIQREPAFQLTAEGLRDSFPDLLLHSPHISNAPRHFRYLVGRHEELDQILELLEVHRHVTIVGPAGIGKSHVAFRIAGEVLQAWAEGSVWVDLVGVTDANGVRLALADAFGLKGVGVSKIESEVIRLLRGRNLFVVFDGADRCHAALTGLVNEIERSSGPKFMFTSMKRLGLSEERVVSLPPLAVPPIEEPLSLEELEDFDATALFLDRARIIRPNLGGESDVAAIAEICRRLDGNPLAIILAAQNVRTHRPYRILERLSSLFGGAKANAAPSKRHQNLANAIEWSCQALAPSARNLLTVASAFRGGWRPDDAAALSERDAKTVSRDIQELQDAGLVEEVECPTLAQAFRVQDAVASYVRKTTDRPRAAELAARHSEHFLRFLCQAVDEDAKSGQSNAIRLFDWYRRDFEAACSHTIKPGQHPGTLVEALVLAWPFFYQRDRAKDALALAKRALRACPNRNHVDIARLLNFAGVFAFRDGDTRSSRTYLMEAVQIAKGLGEEKVLASILNNCAILEWIEGRPEKALEWTEQTIPILRKQGDSMLLGRTLRSIEAAATDLGQYARADEANEEAGRLLASSRSGVDIWAGLTLEGLRAWRQSDFAKAREKLQLSAATARKIGDLGSAARSYLWLAQVEADAGEYERAAEYLGVMKASGSGTGSHLYPTNELRAARIEGLVRAKIGPDGLREHRLWGEITAGLGH
jgi:non-specific serine/threonine protein kinase